jgi:hypothetical protein
MKENFLIITETIVISFLTDSHNFPQNPTIYRHPKSDLNEAAGWPMGSAVPGRFREVPRDFTVTALFSAQCSAL